MTNVNKFKEILDLCNSAQNDSDVQGWNTLHEFDNSSPNKDFNAKVYMLDNNIIITFVGTNMTSFNDLNNDRNIIFKSSNIPSQYGDAERLYNQVKSKYPNTNIEFAGYSLGGSLANLLSHRTGLPSTAIAPIGSEHIAKAYPEYFQYNGDNITTYGRNGDVLFNSNLSKQSGNIYILPDVNLNGKGIHIPAAENHFLHNFKPNEVYQAKQYKKDIIKPVPTYSDVTNGRVDNPQKLLRTQLTGYASALDANQSDLSDYTNPLTGNNRIFTREDIEAMSNDEFAKYEKEIDAQISAMKGFMPTNNDLEYEAQYNGGVVYVHPYTRSDGTEVKGYYRSMPRF